MMSTQEAGPLPAHRAAFAERRPSAYETLERPEQVPLYRLVPVHGPRGETLDIYRGVQRTDTGSVLSVVSSRYGLVGHRDVAMAAHQLGAALEAPDAGAPASLVHGGQTDGTRPPSSLGVVVLSAGRRARGRSWDADWERSVIAHQSRGGGTRLRANLHSKQAMNWPLPVSTGRQPPQMGHALMVRPHEVLMRPCAMETITTESSVMASPTAMVMNCFLRESFFSAGISSMAPVMCWIPNIAKATPAISTAIPIRKYWMFVSVESRSQVALPLQFVLA